jgi:hypothetical protein
MISTSGVAAWRHGIMGGIDRRGKQSMKIGGLSVSVNMKDIGGNKHGGGERKMKNGGGGNNQREKSSGGDACPLSRRRYRNSNAGVTAAYRQYRVIEKHHGGIKYRARQWHGVKKSMARKINKRWRHENRQWPAAAWRGREKYGISNNRGGVAWHLRKSKYQSGVARQLASRVA